MELFLICGVLPFVLVAALEAWTVAHCRNKHMTWIVPTVLGVVVFGGMLAWAVPTQSYGVGFLMVPMIPAFALGVAVGLIAGEKWKARKK